MLNITQTIWALLSILNRAQYVPFIWQVDWFYIHGRLLRYIYRGLFPSTDAMIKYLNIIMCLERFVATKYPFKYIIICSKRRIYGGTLVCALWAILTSYIPHFALKVMPKAPCVKLYKEFSHFLTDEFKYFTKCYWYEHRRPFINGPILDLFDLIITVVTYHVIPLVMLSVFGFSTLRVLKQTKQPQLSYNLSENVILMRQKTERQLTRLVLGLFFINLLGSNVHLIEWLYMDMGGGMLKWEINKLIGAHVVSCVWSAFFLLISLLFLFNPICYIMYNKTVRNNIKTMCRCSWK